MKPFPFELPPAGRLSTRPPLRAAPLLVVALSFVLAAPASAKTHRVTNDEELYIASRSVDPGDLVEVQGPRVYKGRLFFQRPGTKEAPITVRGVTKDGKTAVGTDRPRIVGGDNTITINGGHYLFEALDISGGDIRCVFVYGPDVVLRDLVIHDCKLHGLLSADEDSGNLLVDRCEFFGSGNGDRNHQIYVTSDQWKHPGSVFRLQFSYIHDGKGGHNVKSRAERNEIYFNWIEGAVYHELELIGPDVRDPPAIREDSEIVGNVIRKTTDKTFPMRLGGDGTMDTDGRYRLVNNTFILVNGQRAPLRLFEGVESVELYNNVFFLEGGGPIKLFRTELVEWTRGKPVIVGSHNFIPEGSTEVPSELSGTVTGDPKFVDLAGFDLRPAPGSPLVDAGAASTPTNPEAPFPRPLPEVTHQPPRRGIPGGTPRPKHGPIDIGAFEAGEPSASVGSALATPTNGAPPAAPTPKAPDTPAARSRCNCSLVGAPRERSSSAFLLLGFFLLAWRRRLG
ncbi:MAG: hypothetical protein KC731_08015 [Myxococcales bacterium]|nr:hypothetical protein [Myxococcales bacterium]